MARRASRRDGNEQGIVFALRAAGATVQRLDIKGAPDLLVGYLGVNLLIEVKDPSAMRGAAQSIELTPDQVRWHADWAGQVYIATSEREALELLASVRATNHQPRGRTIEI